MSHSADYKFKHNSQDCVNPRDQNFDLFPPSLWQLPLCKTNPFWKNQKNWFSYIFEKNVQVIAKRLLLGNEKLNAIPNKSKLRSAIEFQQATERFKSSLFIKTPKCNGPFNSLLYLKATWSYNQFHNILRLFGVLPNFRLTTNETERDCL